MTPEERKIDDSKNTDNLEKQIKKALKEDKPIHLVATPPNTEDVMGLDDILGEPISCGERLHINMGLFCQPNELCKRCLNKVESAKSKLTKYIEQQVLIGRIEELERLDHSLYWKSAPTNIRQIGFERITTLKAQLKK